MNRKLKSTVKNRCNFVENFSVIAGVLCMNVCVWGGVAAYYCVCMCEWYIVYVDKKVYAQRVVFISCLYITIRYFIAVK